MGFQAFSRNVEPNIELEDVGGPILNPAVFLFGDNRAMKFAPPGIPRRLVGRDSNFERETSLRHFYAFQLPLSCFLKLTPARHFSFGLNSPTKPLHCR
jgi:hypothetical protein